MIDYYIWIISLWLEGLVARIITWLSRLFN